MSEERRTTLIWAIGILVVSLVAVGLIFLTPLGMFVIIPLSMYKIHAVENRMQRPEISLEVATNLALYCQSADLLQITDYVGVARLPQPIPQLGSPYGMLQSKYAFVQFGGGFYHYGYRLTLDEDASTRRSNVWQLFLEREGSPDKLLQTVILPAAARVPVATFLSNSLAEYDARLAKTPRELQLHQAKIGFLLQYDRSQAREACTNAIAALPDHWWPRLTIALFDTGAGHFGEASSNFVKFVESKPSYSRYTYLAYFYQELRKPRDAANAIEKAISFPVTDLDDDENNTKFRGYSAGVYLYENREYSTVVKLCDALLPTKENGDYAKAALSELKAAAQKALAGGKPQFHADGSILGFDPYDRLFDVHALVSPKNPRRSPFSE